ncbi:MAG: adenosylcobinamide-phosphate synthase [Oleiphilaceae bacterium]|jgi:adenosylcobinamide-phosphate synthase
MFDFSLAQFSIVHLSIFSLTLCVLLALCLDKIIGEAERFHPLIGFGNIAKRIEVHFNKGAKLKLKGFFALILCVIPISVLGYFLSVWLRNDLFAEIIFSSFILYITIGWRSLLEHGKAVYEALEKNNLSLARKTVSRIVSRDCDALNETEIAVAATESVLENGADAIFAAIFWFMVAGVPGVICYRLANTLDAMWGYKNKRFLKFGWAAARFDDALNYFPARLTALSYALMGHTRNALSCWLRQAKLWNSPNAGPVMATGAGALQVSLGGKAIYQGTTHLRPLLGLRLSQHTRANAKSIKAACMLVNKAVFLWTMALVSIIAFAEPQSSLNFIRSTLETGYDWLGQ